MLYEKKIVVTGGSGRFAQALKKIKSKYKFVYPNKSALNITNLNSVSYLDKQGVIFKRHKPEY